MKPLLLLSIYSVLVVGSSLLGGWLPTRLRFTHTRMQLVLSFVGGLMLGIAVLHLLPHAVVTAGSLDVAVISALAGLLVMFFLIRIFHFHEHGPADFQPADADEPASHFHEHAPDHDCDVPGHAHQHGHGHTHSHESAGAHKFSWFGIVFGLALHTLIDGVALGAAVVSEASHNHGFPIYGLGVFLAVLLHKPLDALSVTAVMGAGGWSNRAIGWVNLTFALMCPVGAYAVYYGFSGTGQSLWLGAALGFSAGVFLCISLSDLLPELQFHTHDRVKLSFCLLLGVSVAFWIGLLEPDHAHDMQGIEGHDHGGNGDAEHAEHDHGHSHE